MFLRIEDAPDPRVVHLFVNLLGVPIQNPFVDIGENARLEEAPTQRTKLPMAIMIIRCELSLIPSRFAKRDLVTKSIRAAHSPLK